MDFKQRLDLLRALNGIDNSPEPPDNDEEYAIFTSGKYADRKYKRIPRPSYSQRKKVERIRLKSAVVPEQVKKAICKDLGWDSEEATQEFPAIAYHQKILPHIVREDLPEDWSIDDVSGHEVQRMLTDFLLGT